MRILVTGGAGFVGSHVVDLLLAGGHEVVVLDSLVAHGAGPPPWLQPNAELVRGDVRDADAWRAAVRGIDAVCHQAARVGLGVDFGDVRRYVDDNDAGTAAGLWVLHDTGFQGRFVLASSMVVYGEGRYRCHRHGDVRPGARTAEDLAADRFDPACPACGDRLTWAPIDEDAPTDPRNVYAATKLHQEHLCAAFGREHGVPVTALRYHNVYGPRMPKRHALRRRGLDFPVHDRAGRAAPGVRGRRTDPRLRPRVRRGPRQRGRSHHRRPGGRAAERRLRSALAPSSTWPGPAVPARGLEPIVVGGGRLGDVRHVVASPARAAERLGFRAVEPFDVRALPTNRRRG